MTYADVDGVFCELACGNFAIGWDTMQPNCEGNEGKIGRTIEGEGVVYLSRTVDIGGQGAGTCGVQPRNKVGPRRGGLIGGMVDRMGPTDHSENGSRNGKTELTLNVA